MLLKVAMPFNFSSPEYLSPHKRRKNGVSPVSRASPAHMNSPLGITKMVFLECWRTTVRAHLILAQLHSYFFNRATVIKLQLISRQVMFNLSISAKLPGCLIGTLDNSENNLIQISKFKKGV